MEAYRWALISNSGQKTGRLVERGKGLISKRREWVGWGGGANSMTCDGYGKSNKNKNNTLPRARIPFGQQQERGLTKMKVGSGDEIEIKTNKYPLNPNKNDVKIKLTIFSLSVPQF